MSAGRLEDARLLRGQGRFVDDLGFPGALHGVVLRSPHPAAILRRLDVAAALRVEGIVGVVTAEELARDGVGDLPFMSTVEAPGGGPVDTLAMPLLARDAVRYVGEPVAFAVAESPAAAREAAERIVVAYAPGDCVTDLLEAARPGAPPVQEGGGNVVGELRMGDPAACRGAPSRRPEAPQQPAGSPPDGAARGDRALRRGERNLDAPLRQPGAASRAGDAGIRVRRSTGAHPGQGRRHRRRVRRPGDALRRRRAGAPRGQAFRPPGPLARRARRDLPGRVSRARPRRRDRDRLRRRARNRRPAGRRSRQSRRLCHAVRHSDRDHDGQPDRHRRVPRAGGRHRGEDRADQHRADRALSRCGAAGGDFPARTGARHGRLAARRRPGRAAPAQSGAQGRAALPRGLRARL